MSNKQDNTKSLAYLREAMAYLKDAEDRIAENLSDEEMKTSWSWENQSRVYVVQALSALSRAAEEMMK